VASYRYPPYEGRIVASRFANIHFPGILVLPTGSAKNELKPFKRDFRFNHKTAITINFCGLHKKFV